MSEKAIPSIDELRLWWSKSHGTPEAMLALRTRSELSADALDALKLAYAETMSRDLDDALDSEFHLAIMWVFAQCYEAARDHVHAELVSTSDLHALLEQIADAK